MRALTLLFAVVLAAPVHAQPQAGPEALKARAMQLSLWSDPAWLRLGHYRPDLFGGWKSQADGGAFFLASDGKTNPSHEGEATLDAFFYPADPSVADSNAQHALCRFPARKEFLQRRLGIDPAAFPKVICAKLDAFVQRMAPKSASFIFSSFYFSNPGSMFGHTLLRLNKDERTEDGKAKELLDWGINYAGLVDTTNPVMYAVKGTFGLFKGSFSQLPYFYKVREYNDFESRDLWEYRLSLTDDELHRLVLHLWELGQTYFDYYYVDENCSWHLLSALEAAAPRLDLLSHLKPMVLPTDALKALFHTPGLVTAVHHRPSLRSQFNARAALLQEGELQEVQALEQDPAAPLPGSTDQQVRVLDTAMDYLDLLHARALVFDKDPEAAKRRHKLLVRRAKLGVASPELVDPVSEQESPHHGHGSMRMGFSGGGGLQGGFFEWSFRALLHDPLDPPRGYPDTSVVELLPLRVRYEPARGAVSLEDAQLIRMANLSPASFVEMPAAWEVQLGAVTVRDGGCDACLVGQLRGGAGVALEPFGPSALFWVMGSGQLSAGPGLHGAFGSAVRPSVGPTAGVRLHLGERVSTQLTLGGWLHFETRRRLSWDAAWTTRLHLTSTTSVELGVRRQEAGTEASMGALFYF